MAARITRITLYYVALLLVFCAAPAKGFTGSYPGQYAATDAMSVATQKVALDFWRDRGLDAAQICPNGIKSWYATDLTDDDGIFAGGRGWACEAWLIDWMDVKTPSDYTAWGLVWTLETSCTTWTHEYGHALGLEHTATGVMDPTASETPWACVHFARQQARARHLAAHETYSKCHGHGRKRTCSGGGIG
jgi:hypothetical protein